MFHHLPNDLAVFMHRSLSASMPARFGTAEQMFTDLSRVSINPASYAEVAEYLGGLGEPLHPVLDDITPDPRNPRSTWLDGIEVEPEVQSVIELLSRIYDPEEAPDEFEWAASYEAVVEIEPEPEPMDSAKDPYPTRTVAAFIAICIFLTALSWTLALGAPDPQLTILFESTRPGAGPSPPLGIGADSWATEPPPPAYRLRPTIWPLRCWPLQGRLR